MDFARPEFLWIAALIFILGALSSIFLEWRLGAKARESFHYDVVWPFLFLALKHGAFWFLVSLVIIVLFASPQKEYQRETLSAKNVYTVCLFDVSWSMEAVEYPDSGTRLDRSKELCLSLLPSLRGGYVSVYGFTNKVGSFADFDTDLDFIAYTVEKIVAVEAVMGTGSDVTNALRRVSQQFPDDAQKRRLLVLFSDGGQALGKLNSEELGAVAAFLRNEDIHLIVVGVGKSGGTPIGFDSDGTPVIAYFYEETLRYIAQQAGGAYLSEKDAREAFPDFLHSSAKYVSGGLFTETATKDTSMWFMLVALLPFTVLWIRFRN